MRKDETWRKSAFSLLGNEDDNGEFVENLVFIGMAFTSPSEKSDTYQAIKRSCENAGLNPLRVDEIQDSGPIPVQILKGIEDAEFLIFDLTVERPNVYYELGYAHGCGNRANEIVLLAQKGTKIHFDIASLRILEYDNYTDLEQKLTKRLVYLIDNFR